MKIAILSFYSGLVDRGVETFVAAIAKRLGKTHEVMVIQAGKVKTEQNYMQIQIPYDFKPVEKNENAFLKKIMLDTNSRNIAGFSIKAISYLDSFQPEIIIAANHGWQTLITKFYTKLKKIKLVISAQVAWGREIKWNLLNHPDLYIVQSKKLEKKIRSIYPKQNVVTIYNGVDVPFFSKASNNASKQIKVAIEELPKPIILCVAGHESYKRVADTIQAVAKLSAASLLVIGGSKQTQILGKKILGKRFFQTKIAHEEMPAIYQKASVFTLVSTQGEGFGIAYLEALACNCPVVATDDNLRHEIIGKAGLYVKDPTNHIAYAQKLQQALDKNWHEIPRQRATLFDWDSIAYAYECELQKLLYH